jgi:predicted nucleic acid-binding protein
MTSEHIWTWLQIKGKIFKVISDPEQGIIQVINEKGEILIRKTNLSKRQVETVEKNFLHHIAKRLNGRGHLKTSEKQDSFDPMIS